MPVLDAAVPDTKRAVEGTVVTYTCNPGYRIADDYKVQTITCQSGEWQHVSYLSQCHSMYYLYVLFKRLLSTVCNVRQEIRTKAKSR